MFENPIRYPCAIVEDTSESCSVAIQWLKSHMQPNDQFTLWVPHKENLTNNNFLKRLRGYPSIKIVTTHRVLNPNGVVLAMYPSIEKLAYVTGGQGTRALAVVESTDNLDIWANEVGATRIHSGDSPVESDFSPYEQEPELIPEIIKALVRMTSGINHNNTITGKSHERHTVITELRNLRNDGINLPAKSMAQWAVAHGWQGDNPKYLMRYVEEING